MSENLISFFLKTLFTIIASYICYIDHLIILTNSSLSNCIILKNVNFPTKQKTYEENPFFSLFAHTFIDLAKGI